MSLGLIPCIDKPTRITSCTNTLIDCIYTNNIYYSINSVPLINDIADHLPVFIICPYHVQRHEIREYTNVRRNSGESILMLRNMKITSMKIGWVYFPQIILILHLKI